MNVEWRHCEWYVVDGVKYLRIYVNGKTGGRYLIAKHECIKVLQRLHSRQDDIKDKHLDLVLAKVSKLIFRNDNLLKPRTFNGIFSKLMRDSGLMWNAQEQNRTLYSLRHTYATQELLSGTDIHTLAKQMGTSVRMLEIHYSKLTATMAAERLA
jgi:integrase